MSHDDRKRRRRTPAQDKALDYARQRRHYSDADKAARKTRPRIKKTGRRQRRRRLDAELHRAMTTWGDTDMVGFDEHPQVRDTQRRWHSGMPLGDWVEWRQHRRLSRGAIAYVHGQGDRHDPDRLRAWLEQLMESRSAGTVPQARVLAEVLDLAPSAPELRRWYGRHFDAFVDAVEALGPELCVRLTAWIEHQLALDDEM